MRAWVDEQLYSWLWVFDVFRTFDFLDPWPMVLSPLDDGALRTNWMHIHLLLYVICCTSVIHGGWVDRLMGVTAVLRTALLR